MLRYKRIGERTYALVRSRWVNWSKYIRAALRKVYINMALISLETAVFESPIASWNYVYISKESLDIDQMLERLKEFSPDYYEFFTTGYYYRTLGTGERHEYHLPIEEPSIFLGVEKRREKGRALGHEALYRVYSEAEGKRNLELQMIRMKNPVPAKFSLQHVGIDWDNVSFRKMRSRMKYIRKKYKYKAELKKSMRPGHYHVIIRKELDFDRHIGLRWKCWDDEMRIEIDKWRYKNQTVFNVLYDYKYY